MATHQIIDIVAGVLIVLYACYGLYRGFLKSFISFFGTILSILFAVLLCGTTTNFLEKQFSFASALSESIGGALASIFGATMDIPLSSANNGTLPGIALWIVNSLLKIKDSGELPSSTTLNQIISPIFAYYLANVISFIVLFIIFKIIFFLVGDIFDKVIKKVNITNKINKTLGFILGIFNGIIVINLLIIIINVIPLEFAQEISANIHLAPFTNFLNSINIFSLIFNSLNNVGNLIEIIKNLL